MATGADIVAYAKQQIGSPYVFGAEGPNEFDCSGLVNYVYRHFGISTPRTTADMISKKSPLIPITRAQLQPGDLIMSHWGSNRPSSHVAIYAGDNKVIEASHPGTNVRMLTYGPSYTAHTDHYFRVPGINGATSTPGGGTGGNANGGGGVLGAILGPGGQVVAELIPKPANVTEALTNLGGAMAGVAAGAVNVGELAGTVGRALLPSNMLRAAFFMFGTIFVLIGILFLAREVKESA